VKEGDDKDWKKEVPMKQNPEDKSEEKKKPQQAQEEQGPEQDKRDW